MAAKVKYSMDISVFSENKVDKVKTLGHMKSQTAYLASDVPHQVQVEAKFWCPRDDQPNPEI